MENVYMSLKSLVMYRFGTFLVAHTYVTQHRKRYPSGGNGNKL